MTSHAELTEQNRKLMAEVARALFVENDADKFGTFVSDEGYVQHNPQIADGKEAVVNFLRKEFEMVKRELIGTVDRIVVDGDIGVSHSHFVRRDGQPGGLVFVDIFRIRDGKLVEHWDVIQPMPTESANTHGMI